VCRICSTASLAIVRRCRSLQRVKHEIKSCFTRIAAAWRCPILAIVLAVGPPARDIRRRCGASPTNRIAPKIAYRRFSTVPAGETSYSSLLIAVSPLPPAIDDVHYFMAPGPMTCRRNIRPSAMVGRIATAPAHWARFIPDHQHYVAIRPVFNYVPHDTRRRQRDVVAYRKPWRPQQGSV